MDFRAGISAHLLQVCGKANDNEGRHMNSTAKREQFRKILSGARCVFPASTFDPISARIAEDLGFESAMLAGSVASLTVLGAPDIVLLTLSEFVEQARRICRATSLPLLVDADHGYGNALNVKRTVEELEAARISALTIEDTLLPLAFGGDDRQLISLEEGVGKMRAALAGRGDPALVVIGRTSALAITDREDAAVRMAAYEAVGVDAIFLGGLRSRAELDWVAGKTKLPLVLGGVPAEMQDLDYLSSRGVRVCVQSHNPFAAAVEAVQRALKSLRDGVKPSAMADIAGPDLMKRVTRQASYTNWTREFLGVG
jgi:carboxyvinyl-carboxyphosphonate phosphorylmutase